MAPSGPAVQLAGRPCRMRITVTLALLALAASLGSWILYMNAIARERVPPRPWGHVAAQGFALAAVATAIWLARDGGLGAPIAAATLVIPLAGLFLFLLSQAPVPDTQIRVAVGQPMLPIRATTSDAQPWSSDGLRGRRVLFKFYRGGW